MPGSPNRRVEYYEYINSPQWRWRANQAKQRAGNRCQICNRHASEITLNAHHRTYERLGNESPDDITVLCRSCHELYETNKKLSKPPSYQPPVYTPTYSASTYTSTAPKVDTPVQRNSTESANDQNVVIAIFAAAFILSIALASLVGVKSSPPPVTSRPTRAVTSTPTGDDPYYYVIRTTSIHKGPGSNFPSAGEIEVGSEINVAGCNEGCTWYKLGVREWVSATDVMALNPPTPTAVGRRYHLKQDAHIRTGPGVKYESIRIARAGDVLDVIGCNQPCEWLELADGTWVLEHAVNTGMGLPTTGPTSAQPTATAVPPTNTTEPTSTPTVQPATATPTEPPPRPTATPPPPRGCPGGCVVYPTWCGLPIKGNISQETGEKIYHTPDQRYYDSTKLSPEYGERWFCTADEAQAAGWRRARR
jgi:uncharacterized protein YraI